MPSKSRAPYNTTGSMNMAKVLTTITAALLLAGTASSDLATDETQCRDQLLNLTPCLGFVSGQARTPSLQCCSVLAGKLNATKKCMCILVRDRNEPGLGLEIDANLALSLPSMCHAHSNASKCIDLLGLSPSSQAAQVFIQFDKNKQANKGVTASGVVSASTMPRFGWYVNAKCEAILLCCLVFVLAWLLSL